MIVVSAAPVCGALLGLARHQIILIFLQRYAFLFMKEMWTYYLIARFETGSGDLKEQAKNGEDNLNNVINQFRLMSSKRKIYVLYSLLEEITPRIYKSKQTVTKYMKQDPNLSFSQFQSEQEAKKYVATLQQRMKIKKDQERDKTLHPFKMPDMPSPTMINNDEQKKKESDPSQKEQILKTVVEQSVKASQKIQTKERLASKADQAKQKEIPTINSIGQDLGENEIIETNYISGEEIFPSLKISMPQNNSQTFVRAQEGGEDQEFNEISEQKSQINTKTILEDQKAKLTFSFKKLSEKDRQSVVNKIRQKFKWYRPSIMNRMNGETEIKIGWQRRQNPGFTKGFYEAGDEKKEFRLGVTRNSESNLLATVVTMADLVNSQFQDRLTFNIFQEDLEKARMSLDRNIREAVRMVDCLKNQCSREL